MYETTISHINSVALAMWSRALYTDNTDDDHANDNGAAQSHKQSSPLAKSAKKWHGHKNIHENLCYVSHSVWINYYLRFLCYRIIRFFSQWQAFTAYRSASSGPVENFQQDLNEADL